MPMSCQASARIRTVAERPKTAIARLAMARSSSGSGGARMKATRPRSPPRGTRPTRRRGAAPARSPRREHAVGVVERAGQLVRAPQVGQALRALGRLHLEEAARALEQRRSGGRLDAVERAPARAAEEPAALRCEGAGLVVDPAELCAVPVRLLEVVADDLVVRPVTSAARCSSQLARRACRSAAELLRHRGVRDVADEDVVEAEAVVARKERVVRDARTPCARGRGDRPEAGAVPREQLATAPRWNSRPSTEARCTTARSAGLEAVDARGQERLDGRRHGLVCRVAGRRRAWRGSARRRAGCPRRARRSGAEPRGARSRPAAAPRRAVRLRRRQRIAARRASRRGGCRPGRALVEQVGTGEAEEQDWCAAREAGDVLEEVEQRRLRPVDVVDRDDERPPAGERLEQAPERPRRLVRRARVLPCAPAPAMSRAATSPRSTCASRAASSGCGSSPATSRTTSASGRYVTPARTRRTARRARARLARSTCISSRARRDLPMPGVPTIVAQLHARSPDREVEGAARARSTSRRGVRPGVAIGRTNAGTSGRSSSSRQAASGSTLPLATTGAARSTTTASRTSAYVARPTSTSPGRAACSRRAATLTASPVASFSFVRAAADDHLTRVDTGAGHDPDAVLARQVGVRRRSRSLAGLERGPRGTQCVVLVDGGNAEDGHDRVADELLDGAAVRARAFACTASK